MALLNARSLVSSLERIQYNVKSPLRLKLTTLFQECIDVVKAEQKDRTVLAAAYTHSISITLRKKVSIQARLSKILADELNMNLKELYLGEETSPNAFMAPLPSSKHKEHLDLDNSLDDIMEFLDQRNSAGGNDGRSEDEYRDSIVNLLKTIGKGVDENTGRFTDDTSESIDIHLGINVCMFNLGAFHPKAGDMTAAEIAAIVLHELGHGVTLTELMKDFYYRSTTVTDTVRYLSANVTEKNLDVAVNAVEKFMVEQKAEIPADLAKKFNQVIKNVKNRESNNLQVMSVGFFAPLIPILFSVVILPWLNRLIIGMDNAGALTDRMSPGSKQSDVVTTGRNFSYLERIADEFAARHGAAGDIATAMSKLYAASGTAIFARKRQSAIANGLYVMWDITTSILGMMLPPNYTLSFPYEDARTRFVRMKQDVMAIFKDPELPKELREHMINQVKLTEKALAEFDKPSLMNLKEFIWGTVFRLTKQGTVISSLIDGNMAADYYKLLHSVDHLVRQPLYYQAARLGSLRDRHK